MVSHEEVLDRYLPEDVQALLDLDEAKCMFPSNVYGSFLKREGRESSTKLICL
jgi:hypothetical protein